MGTSPEHYRAWHHWSKDTRTTRTTATVFFKHKYITNPTVTPADAIVAAATNLADALQNNIPAQHLGKTKLKDLKRLQKILEEAATSPRVANAKDEGPPELVVGYDSNSDSDYEDKEPPRISTQTTPR